VGYAFDDELLGPAPARVLAGQTIVARIGIHQDHLPERPRPGNTRTPLAGQVPNICTDLLGATT
jgi:hypothetical protein